MFSKNLSFYRLRKGWTKQRLAEEVNLSPMIITLYEAGKRVPTLSHAQDIATALDVSLPRLLEARNAEPTFDHRGFRKLSSLSQASQSLVRASIEDYFSRLFFVDSLFPESALGKVPTKKRMDFSIEEDDAVLALKLRKQLGFPLVGPIHDLGASLETRGFLFCPVSNVEGFLGLNGTVNKRPYIAYSTDLSCERLRSTIAHELVHLYFCFEDEKKVDAVAGCFLFGKEDAFRELGTRRSNVSQDMVLVAKEYGISMYLLVHNAEKYGIISPSIAKQFYVRANQAGWRKKEPSRCNESFAPLLENLVYRAVSESEISIQKGAELLRCSYEEVERNTLSLKEF